MWLAPEQVRILPIAERHHENAMQVLKKLEAAGLRACADTRSEKIGYKIREAQLEKIPYMLIIGDKEAENGTVSIRSRKDGDKGTLSVDAFLTDALMEIAAKTR